MSDPKQQKQDSDELDLDVATVRDLDLVERDADDVRGGTGTCGVQAHSDRCPTGK